MAAWLGWYDEWVDGLVREALRQRPWLGWSEEVRQRAELDANNERRWLARVRPLANTIADELAQRNWKARVVTVKNSLRIERAAHRTWKDAVKCLRIVGAVRTPKDWMILEKSPDDTRMALAQADLSHLARVVQISKMDGV